MSLSQFSTRYPVTIAMATLAVVLLGWISFDRLGTDLLPDLQTPVVTIDLRAPGKAPREMEERFTRRIERDISTVRQVKRVYSVTRSGQAVVVAEFSWDADMDFALLDVQKKVATYEADDEVSLLDVSREDPQASSVMRLAIVADDDLDALVGTVETLVKSKLESLAGVASAELEGGAVMEVRVTLDPYLLEAFGLSSNSVVDRIQAANSDISGGTLREGQQSFLVKALGRLKDADDVRELIVGERRESGSAVGTLRVPVRVRDIGNVALVYQEQETIVRLNGQECVGLAIYKEAGSNTVTVVNTVLSALDDLMADLPGLEFVTVENQARFIEDAIGEVEESALYGAILAIGVLLIALRSWTATLVIGVAIPISILATFTLMYFQDLTLNIMTLGGLALGSGMLVDNAIVVIENIYRHLETGADSKTASAKGASEVGVAILASTLTTVSVFLPIVYVQGLAGELFQDQAWTVAYSLICSLAVAMTTVPMLTARFLKKVPKHNRTGLRSERYGKFLSGVLNHKLLVGGTTFLLILTTVGLFKTLETEFIPREDQGLFQIDMALPEGSRLELTDKVSQRVGQIVTEVGSANVSHVYIRSGVDPSRVSGAGEPTGPNRASVIVALAQERVHTVSEIVDAMDTHLRDLPNVELKYQLHETALEGVMGGQDAPIQLEVSGDNIDILTRLTSDLSVRMEVLPAIYNVQTSFQGGQPEVDLKIREEVAAAFGLNTQTISRTLDRQLSGEIAGELSKDQRTRDIRVKYADVNLKELGSLRIESTSGAILTLGDVADMQIIEGPREILRESQKRVGRISAYVPEGFSLSSAIEQINQVTAQMAVPSGYRITMGGEERQRSESFDNLKFALILSIVLVYMVMASLFESLLHPFTVMLSVPLAGIGVVFAFFIVQEPLSVMAYIGIIMLGGIAVNDAIVLVDRINQLRQDLSLREAVLHGAQDRLRPILMTSATTILALLPMVLGVGEGAKLRAPMAVAVIGGLLTSTLMTLVLIPVMYETIDRLRGRPSP
ncbi:MAG: efflux RND transporter permease subunit [Candidatus Latescibacteria bacterium]|jgi:hydrophobic/amphiphilic exporter-1 (mainly G- bacteria), HAE1 family|nr:efflux RND transporter permease subunit [Candidatus Latescibacterota bacterium]